VIVVLPVFEAVRRLVVFLGVLTVMALGLVTEPFGLLGLFAGIALREPDAAPDGVLDLAALEFRPNGRALLGYEKHARVVIAAIREAGRGPFGPVLPARAQNGGDLHTETPQPFRVVVVPHEGAVLAVPAVLVPLLVLAVLDVEHESSAFPGGQDAAEEFADKPRGRTGDGFLGVGLGDRDV